jgi:hypothetical protein
MTSQEYEEEIQELKGLYMGALEDYHRAKENLRIVEEWNSRNVETIRDLRETIE